jgi:chromosome segregation ATPase
MLDLKFKDKNSDKIVEELTSMHSTLKEQNTNFEEIKKEFEKFKSEIKELKEIQQGSLKEFKSNLNEIIESKQKLQQELTDFKVMKGHFQDKVIDTLSNQINENTEKLKTDVKNYNDLKKEIAEITQEIQKVRADLVKFKEVSEKISKMDFDLTHYAKNLERENQDKLRLMNEVNFLKRIIAKERRRGDGVRR